MSSKPMLEILQDPETLRSSEFFREVDRDVLQAFQRLLCARITDHPMGIPDERVDWTEFEQALARLCDYARIRHAAKHGAVREAMLVTRPIVVVREGGGDAKLLDGVDPVVLARVLGIER